MKTAAIVCGISLLSLLWSSCSDKKLMANNNNIGSSATLSYDTTSFTFSLPQPETVETLVEDSLGFIEKLDYTIYNRNLNKDLLSRNVSTSATRIPAEVVEDITRKLYLNLQDSGKQNYFNEQSFFIKDVQFYETTNNWNIYFIFVGSEFETTGYLAGCYDKEKRNFILKDLFGDDCATYTFTAPKLLINGLQFSVYENYSCEDGHEELYTNIIAATHDTLQHERVLFNQHKNSDLMVFNSQSAR